MKTKPLSLILFLSPLLAIAGQWTIHAPRINYTHFEVQSGYFGLGHPEKWHECIWDFKHKRSSGYYEVFWNGGNQIWGVPSGYQDTISFQTSEAVGISDLVISVWISGPSPRYSNGTSHHWYSSLGDWGPFINHAGEYWIDYSMDGSLRVSTSEPRDFGKWLSDVSINPYWVNSVAANSVSWKAPGQRSL